MTVCFALTFPLPWSWGAISDDLNGVSARDVIFARYEQGDTKVLHVSSLAAIGMEATYGLQVR